MNGDPYRAVLIVVAIVLTIGVLNVTGFCFSRLRFLTESELIERAVAASASEIAEFADNNAAVSSDAIRAYIRNHPGCCSIDGGMGLPGNFRDSLTGFKSTWVRVGYALRKDRMEASPNEGAFFEALLQIDHCGDVVGGFGERLKKLLAQ